MQDDEQNDVNQTEQTGDNSSESQASETTNNENQTNGEQTNQKVMADGTPEDQKTVPYSVFKEIKQELAEMKQMVTPKAPTQQLPPEQVQLKAQAKEALKPILEEMGYVSREEINRDRQDQALKSTLSELEKEFNGKDGRPKFEKQAVIDFAIENGIANPRLAYKAMNEAALIDWQVQQAITKGKGVQAESSNGSGSQQVGVSDEDLKKNLQNPDARHLYLKRIATDILQK